MKHSLLLCLSLIAASTCWAPEKAQDALERQKCPTIAINAGRLVVRWGDTTARWENGENNIPADLYCVPDKWVIFNNPKPVAKLQASSSI